MRRVEIGHKDTIVRGGQSPRFRSIATGDVSDNLTVTLASHIFIDYRREETELLRRTFVMEVVETLPWML